MPTSKAYREDLPMKTVAFYGGSFNPPHHGHFSTAAWALSNENIDAVWMTPCASHPSNKNLIPLHHRLEMCKLGLDGLPHIQVLDLEAHIPPPNFTIKTILSLIERHPTYNFRLLIGSDLCQEIPRWQDAKRLLALAPPLVKERLEESPLSSTNIRQLLYHNNPSVAKLLHPSILSYIRQHNLYT